MLSHNLLPLLQFVIFVKVASWSASSPSFCLPSLLSKQKVVDNDNNFYDDDDGDVHNDDDDDDAYDDDAYDDKNNKLDDNKSDKNCVLIKQ